MTGHMTGDARKRAVEREAAYDRLRDARLDDQAERIALAIEAERDRWWQTHLDANPRPGGTPDDKALGRYAAYTSAAHLARRDAHATNEAKS